MKDMNIAKLTAVDLPLFNGIVSDLFPGIETPAIDYSKFKSAIEKQFKQSGLQPTPWAITKVIQVSIQHISINMGKKLIFRFRSWTSFIIRSK